MSSQTQQFHEGNITTTITTTADTKVSPLSANSSLNSSQTTLVNNEENGSVTSSNDNNIIPLKDTFNASHCNLRGADSPNIYKELLAKESRGKGALVVEKTTTTTTTAKNDNTGEETIKDQNTTKTAKKVVVPILRGPDSPNIYARYLKKIDWTAMFIILLTKLGAWKKKIKIKWQLFMSSIL